MTKNLLRQQILTLHYVYPLPLQKFRLLLSTIKDLDQLYSIPQVKLAQILNVTPQKANQIKKSYMDYRDFPFEETFQEKHYQAITYNDPYYPKELFQLIDPPTVLYAMGDISLLSAAKIAIIGSRNATNYSEKALEYIVPPLILNKYAIVSGMAKGADTMAHNSAIMFGGKTIAVLGSGFQHIYPRENTKLFQLLTTEHCVISEFPPYMGPKKWHFPLRNRIISGLSRALVVTEAAERSGTIITTEHALEHGKDVFIVPGPINSNLSSGTNKLIREGAIPVWNGYQIVNEIQLISNFLRK